MANKQSEEYQRMWHMIEAVNWKEVSIMKDIDEAKNNILINLSFEESQELNTFISKRRYELCDAVGVYEEDHHVRCGDYSGDDSFGDMVLHVIGLGQETFDKVMDNPGLLNTNKSLGSDYVECFSYCIPYDDDYLLCEPGNIEYDAKKYLNDLQRDKYDVLYKVFNLLGGKEGKEELTFSELKGKIESKSIAINEISGMAEIEELEVRLSALVHGDLATATADFEEDSYSRLFTFEGNTHSAMYVNLLISAIQCAKVQAGRYELTEQADSLELSI